MSETVFIHHGWSVRPVAGRIGAEISGVRLDGSLPAQTVQGIRRALLQYKVLFFRGQIILTMPSRRRSAAFSATSSPTRRFRRARAPRRSSSSTPRAAAGGPTIGTPM